ncbi:MAG: sel1 repeat family protein [Sphingomonas sp.]|uniref:SEL1-like repeat protein n=1 Tax=Sphingomonas sp. TaxID=28214 RepID=UPI001B2E2D26|nr:tetratricopeptide repeat protein [Sphingomonas sp.]MBO9622378.1 sel1 repeat family protein [Sphingomonas sp.]
MQGRAHGRFWAVVLGTAVLIPGLAHAQTASESGDQKQVVVEGKRMPGAEAPRSATCEMMARDPFYQALFAAAGGPFPFLPTRLPRDPDYSAPPLVPPGSPLPDLAKARFGVRDANLREIAIESAPPPLSEEGGAGISIDEASFGNAVQGCRAAFVRGGASTAGSAGSGFVPASSSWSENGASQFDPASRAAAANGRYIQARAEIAGRDTTLPMGFALFDQRRFAESLVWFKKAASKLTPAEGGDEATLFVGKLYLQGLGDKSDPVEAVKWLKKTAESPFNPARETPLFDPRRPELNTAMGEASVILANLYRSGFRGVEKDPEQARKWYARAFEVGHVPAAKVLGDLYNHGIDAPRDVKKAVSWYRKAAKLNYPAAQFALAEILYIGGSGVAQDRKEALGWYQAAARNNHGGGLYALGRAYEFGEGVKADPQRALGFYKSAALRGSAAARMALGTYFYEGKLVPKDDAAARQWFEAAAKGDDPEGMFNLGAMMARGEGGARDVPGAWAWLRRAAGLGNENAPRALAALERRMSPAEKQAASALLTRK